MRKAGDGPSYKIGSEARGSEVRTFSPGPGSYNQTLEVHQKSPAWVMGSSSRRGMSKSVDTPGPGNY